MSIKRNLFQGLSAFPITPMDPDGTVDTDALVRIVERLDVPGVDSIGLLGSTGSYMYLTREQRKRAIDAVIRALRGRKPLIVSAGALRTDDAQRLAKDAEEAGVDGLLLAPVSYNALTEEEVYQHFEAVAGSTALPICIYNTPSTTHFTFSDALLARIAGLPNVVALKQPAPTTEPKASHEALRSKLPSGFSIGYSADWLVAEPLLAGGSAWYSVIAGVLPAPSVALMDGIRRGDHAEVKRVSAVLQPIWDLFKELGDLRVAYALANELGLCKAAPPRPILPIAASYHDRVRSALAKIDESMYQPSL
ncbi:dihydrodipicolinate synthetase [Aaosphaeria arxii CBS 175.79]|uniref:Dihydrodipicolinate synthetase n=1 Tax=Aaosphaeria arxii CBS 175.79 TaxID=1450172 RepID=A0A6A5Y8N1_9PLEO|nr:dihydrodipicolinate synthetase [Aaosphaeria arxii CBS 175.79]KAF2021689.1 dihydrodipicolinate synthetase [Aaosphaeria arxii CBS 175.79]